MCASAGMRHSCGRLKGAALPLYILFCGTPLCFIQFTPLRSGKMNGKAPSIII